MLDLEKTTINTPNLVLELSLLIDESKKQLAKATNSALTLLFWHVGKRIKEEVLKNERRTMASKL